MLRTIVFIDAQNMYHGARTAFGNTLDPPYLGQFSPLKLARLVCERSAGETVLRETRIYTGRPSGSKDPKTYAAHRRQCAAWAKDGVVVV
ncbi:hypothetical protein ACFL59_11040, partial [Planctomycetota bacterium]